MNSLVIQKFLLNIYHSYLINSILLLPQDRKLMVEIFKIR